MIGIVVPVYVPVYPPTPELRHTASTALVTFAMHLGPGALLICVVNGGVTLRESIFADETVSLPVNLGYTQAVNVGLATAEARGCDHFIVGSADVIIGPDTIQSLVTPGVASALEAGAGECETGADVCPFWGGLFSFPASVAARLPERYRRIGDAALAAEAFKAGHPVVRVGPAVEHRHPHAANDLTDPIGEVKQAELDAFTAEFGAWPCPLLSGAE